MPSGNEEKISGERNLPKLIDEPERVSTCQMKKEMNTTEIWGVATKGKRTNFEKGEGLKSTDPGG